MGPEKTEVDRQKRKHPIIERKRRKRKRRKQEKGQSWVKRKEFKN